MDASLASITVVGSLSILPVILSPLVFCSIQRSILFSTLIVCSLPSPLVLIRSIPVLHISIGIYAYAYSASSDRYAQVSNLDHTGVCAIVIG